MVTRQLLTLFACLAFTNVAIAQSLQTAADKQKARRQGRPAPKVFTDEDLARVKAGAPSEPQPAPESAGVAAGSEASETEDRARKQANEDAQKAEKEREWETARQGHQARYDAAKSEIARLRSAQAQCQKNASYMMAYPAMDDCSSYPPQIKAKEIELRTIEDGAADDARRRGVLPGKARLTK